MKGFYLNPLNAAYLVLTVLFLCSSTSWAFIPDAILGVASPSSTFHTAMVTEAMRAVARDFFRSQPRQVARTDDKTKANITDNMNLDDMFETVFGDAGDPSHFEHAVDKIKRATASIDKDKTTKKNPPWHFDSERIVQGHEKLQEHFRNIVNLIKKEEYDTAREQMGRALHPLQDFYSHTNWVEMGKTTINSNIGIPEKPLGIKVAGAQQATCRSCKRDFSSRFKSGLLKASLVGFAFGAVGGDGDNIFDCQDNIIVKDVMTSGYSVNQKDDDGNAVNKPEGIGKCSHGGTLDGSSGKFAEGGMNKDSKSSLFSAHDYLHEKAAPYAINATIYWVNQIRKAVDDDKMFARFLNLLPGTSMAFVVDVSPVMENFIQKVENKIKAILDAYKGKPLIKFLATPFSRDIAGPVFTSPNLEGIFGGENFDKMMAIFKTEREKGYTSRSRKMYEAVVATSQESFIGGQIYVIMDGDPSDERLAPWLSNSLIKKRLSMNIIYATDLKHKHRYKRRAHPLTSHPEARLVDATGGHIITADISGNDIQTAVADLQQRQTESNMILLNRRAHGREVNRIDIDGGISSVAMTVVSMDKVDVMLQDPLGRNVTAKTRNVTIMEQDRFYTIRVIRPRPGVWTLTTYDPAELTDGYSVKVTAQGSDAVTFDILDYDSDSSHPGLQSLGVERPLAGHRVTVIARMHPDTTPVYLEFRDNMGNAIERGELSPTSTPGMHQTSMTIPKKPFIISLFGFDARGRRINRVRHGLFQPATVQLTVERHPESPRNMTPGGFYAIKYQVTNHGEYQLFTITVWDSKGWIVDPGAPTMLVQSGESRSDHVYLAIPKNTPHGTLEELGVSIKGSNTKTQEVADNHWHDTFFVGEADENRL